MSTINIKRVKTSEIELKDRLVSIQRVAKVPCGINSTSSSPLKSWRSNSAFSPT